MWRPGWFPEYNPQDQKIFDQVRGVVERVFQQHNFEHIWTPAVENNEVLLKWWDSVANEIFGLVGLKDYESGDYERAKKSYSLHFDLTVPFARYTLDHIGHLTFPFKRYQIQPVRRGERQQRGRFKEFWQCDVDSIRRSGTQDASRAWAETISVLQKAMNAVFAYYKIDHLLQSHVSHIGLTKAYLADKIDTNKLDDVIKLLDTYHKLDSSVFEEQLTLLVEEELSQEIIDIIETQNLTPLQEYQGYAELVTTLWYLEKLGASVIFDFSIVRWLGYYTWPVFETFVVWEQSLGSVCSGGAYEDFTAFLDNKNIFSGVGGSIGISRMMEIVFESIKHASHARSESYLFVRFDDTLDETIKLYQQFLANGKTCEIYPSDDSFGKQLGYADKKSMKYAVILWADELAKWEYQIKDLETGKMVNYQLEIIN